MKKKFIMIFAAAFSAISCQLDFVPTDSGSGDDLMKNASSAISTIDGIYRSMWTAGWSTGGNSHQCFGISAYNLALESMGDDFIMQSAGSGWFWYDHCYNIKAYYMSDSFRSYDVWYANYTWISNANYVLAAKNTMAGSDVDKSYVFGSAYAIRGLSYFNLANWYARPPYSAMQDKYRWDDPGLPIYTEPTDKGFVGKKRENLRTVFKQINDDLDSAIVFLGRGEKSVLAGGKSHISLNVARALKVRVALATGDWQTALDNAELVIKSEEYEIGGESELMGGMNSISASNVMWGAGIENTEQSGAYAGFFPHMDNTDGAYAESAPKLISSNIYKKMEPDDIRRRWWNPDNEDSPYISEKFRFSNVASWLGDYIYMRVEEMYFDAAEAALRLGDADKAVEYVNAVMSKRSTSYDAGRYTASTYLGATSVTWTGSLLENILIQKRIELWGEFGRLIDIRRLGQGIDRKSADGFADECLTTMSRNGVNLNNPDTYDWVMTIPQDEINNNPNINEEDQNPL